MRIRPVIVLLIMLMFISIGLLISSYFYSNLVLFIIASFMIVVSIVLTLSLIVFDLFQKDKILDLEQLKAQGLTLVECIECGKTNVLEDQYCIYCGEKLIRE